MADEEVDESVEEPETPDEDDLEDEESIPYALEDEADIADDEVDLDDEGGEIDLEVALAIAEGEDEDVTLLPEEDEDLDDEDDEPVREGEFVCNGCHMVFRLTAMADAKAQLCRDCAA